MINDDVPAMPKQIIGQVAIDEQQPSVAFSDDGGFLWGQQSMSSMEEDTSCMEADIFGMCADFAAATPPPLTGNTATARASKNTRMVRPACMGLPLPQLQIADFEAARKAFIEARSFRLYPTSVATGRPAARATQNENPPHSGLRQLPPAADIPVPFRPAARLM
jgi:hypothetical protein